MPFGFQSLRERPSFFSFFVFLSSDCLAVEDSAGPALRRLADVSSHEMGFKPSSVIFGRPTKK